MDVAPRYTTLLRGSNNGSETCVPSPDMESDDSPPLAACVTQRGAGSVLVYATLYGGLVAWDLRAPGEDLLKLLYFYNFFGYLCCLMIYIKI